jgi:opacity protein-like surface antigen
MRNRGLLLVACLLVSASMSLSQVKFGFGPHVGIDFSSFPKAVSQYYGMGFNFGVQGEVDFTKNIGAELAFDYGMFSSDKTKLAGAGGAAASDITGFNVSVVGITVTGIGKLPLNGGVTPYGVFGFGLHISSASDLMYKGQLYASGGDSKTNFGIHFGVGTEYKVSKNIGVFGDFKFKIIFTEGSSTSIFPLTFGMNYWL